MILKTGRVRAVRVGWVDRIVEGRAGGSVLVTRAGTIVRGGICPVRASVSFHMDWPSAVPAMMSAVAMAEVAYACKGGDGDENDYQEEDCFHCCPPINSMATATCYMLFARRHNYLVIFHRIAVLRGMPSLLQKPLYTWSFLNWKQNYH